MHKLNCSNCGKQINRHDWLVEKNKTGLWFCSYTCQRVYRKKTATAPTLLCPVCGKQFTVKPYRLKRVDAVTCSAACRRVQLGWGSRLLNCDWCGQEFRRKNVENKAHNFCSRPCMGHWQSANKTGENSPTWRGGWQPYYGKTWNKRNREARKRDHNTCQGCGVKQSALSYTLEVHHKKPVRLFADPDTANGLDNLITLCRPCHVRADVFARWLFDQRRRQSHPTHALQNDPAIIRVYFHSEALSP